MVLSYLHCESMHVRDEGAPSDCLKIGSVNNLKVIYNEN